MVRTLLPQLEFGFGVAPCGVRPDNLRWQWDFPNNWPCMQEIVVTGLQRYGYLDDARRVAQKYLATVCRSFQETGDLWEKYNVEDGTPNTFAEPSYPNSDIYVGGAAGPSLERAERAGTLRYTRGQLVFVFYCCWAGILRSRFLNKFFAVSSHFLPKTFRLRTR